MLTNLLVAAYGVLMAVTTLLGLTQRIPVRQYAATMAILNALAGVLSAVSGWTSNVYIMAAATALFAWLWWHSGGGDGTRRRLRSWAGRFQGVRRTAPQGA
ncbi:hypothetical protein ACWD4O_38875 [Streptomyces sp. NPDC002623]